MSRKQFLVGPGVKMLPSFVHSRKNFLARWGRVPLAAFILTVLVAGLLFAPAVYAVPASPTPHVVSLPNGQKAQIYLKGDEYLNWHEDSNGYIVIEDTLRKEWVYGEYVGEGVFKATKYPLGVKDPGDAGITRPDYTQLRAFAMEEERERAAAAAALTRAPQTGTMRNLVVLVNFTDISISKDIPNPVPAFDALFNQPGYHQDGAVGSVRDYYHEVSYNQLTVDSTVVGPVTTNYGYANYTNAPQTMVAEALAKLDASGFDFSTMDGDGDGWVDGLTIIHAGGGQEYSGNDSFYIWSHQWQLSSPVEYDGVQMQMYHTEPARRGWDSVPTSQGITRIGVICHENGHFLGLPDLYDRDYSSAGVGEFCLMAAGSWNGPKEEGAGPAHMSAWCKTELGWVTPTVVDASGTYTVDQGAFNQSIYKLRGAFTANEYFLIENRDIAGFDTWLPGSQRGLLIWHVDESVRYVSQNDDETHLFVDLEEADGLQDLQESPLGAGDDSDYFRAGFKTAFTSVSNPNNRGYAGLPLGMDVTDVSSADASMTFTIGAPELCTVAVESTPSSDVSITGSHPGDTTYGVTVFDGTPVTLTAPALADGLDFMRWRSDTGELLSLARTYTFNATGEGTSGPVQSSLYAGTAKVDITPSEEDAVDLTNNDLTIEDNIYARVLVLKTDDVSVAIVSLDLILFSSAKVVADAKAQWGVDHVILSSTHTHSSMAPQGLIIGGGQPDWTRLGDPEELIDWPALSDDPWYAETETRIVAAIGEAMGNLFPARIGSAQAPFESDYMAHNRRLVNANGSVTMLWENPEGAIETEPLDPTVRVIRVDDATGNPRAVMVHYACHPVVLMNAGVLSRDFPGTTVDTIEQELGPDCMAMFLQGAEGDIDTYRVGMEAEAGLEYAENAGTDLGEAAVSLAETISTPTATESAIQVTETMVPIEHRDGEGATEACVVSVLINHDTAMVTIPGEPFIQHQLNLAAKSPVANTMMLGLAYCGSGNPYLIYVPTAQAVTEGGYGAAECSFVEANAGANMVKEAVDDVLAGLRGMRVVAEYGERDRITVAWGWGHNGWGEIGDDTTTNRLSPVQVSDLGDPTKLAGGQCHSMALNGNGIVYTWGKNTDGQLGYELDEGVVTQNAPVAVPGLNHVIDIAAGTRHSLVVFDANDDGRGTVYAWGRNTSGQLGDGTTASTTGVLVQVIDPSDPSGFLQDVVAVAAGEYHSVALKADGTVVAWGANARGQLGDNRATDLGEEVICGVTCSLDSYFTSTHPVVVETLSEEPLSGIVEIACGNVHTLARDADGNVWSWGGGGWGQLGRGSVSDGWYASQVTGVANATHVATGCWHSLAVTQTGGVLSWGANWWGQLGDGTYMDARLPVAVFGLDGVAVKVAAGENHSITLLNTGVMQSWGRNRHGQLGHGIAADSVVPASVTGLENASDLCNSGAWHSFAIAEPTFVPPASPMTRQIGRLNSTGLNDDGQLGLGDEDNRDVFTQQPDMSSVAQMDCGEKHAVLLDRNGNVWTAGNNDWGQLGHGDTTSRNAFAMVSGLSGIVAVDAGAWHTVALDDEGHIWVCGRNVSGALGLGTSDDGTEHSSFTVVSGVDRITAVSAGGYHTLALRDSGTFWAAGRNTNGQLGLDDTADRSAFTQVEGVSGIAALCAGTGSSVVLLNDGTLMACGANAAGELGLGDYDDRDTFTAVPDLSDIAAISLGGQHAFAVDDSGNLWATGSGSNGATGFGNTATRNTYAQVPGISDVSAVVASAGHHSLAIDGDQNLWATGQNNAGQLGLGNTTDRTSFEQVTDVVNCVGVAAGEEFSLIQARRPVTWTFMVYMDGDNNLESYAIADFLEMAQVGSTSEVNIVAMFDRVVGYDTGFGNWTNTRRGVIAAGDTPSATWGESVGEANMGATATVSGFVNWAMDNYPAENYALVFWNHGDGWYEAVAERYGLSGEIARRDILAAQSRGPAVNTSVLGLREMISRAVCFDDSSGSDALSLQEIRSALSAVASGGGSVNLLGFDACLMAMAETAYEFREYSDVMVASEETEPGPGWPYHTLLADLAADPDMTASELGTAIVDRYFEYYDDYTLSAIDLSRMDSMGAAIDTLADALIASWDTDKQPVRDAAQTVMDELDLAVIRNRAGAAEYSGANGLAIYMPWGSYGLDANYSQASLEFLADTSWRNCLLSFFNESRLGWVGKSRYLGQEFAIGHHVDLYDFCERLLTDEDPDTVYAESALAQTIGTGGDIQELALDDGFQLAYSLPFDFQFYGQTYTQVWISDNGVIDMVNNGIVTPFNTIRELIETERIAVMWSDLAVDNIYIDSSDSQVSIRWEGWQWPDNLFVEPPIAINIEVVLYSDGRIQFNYGANPDPIISWLAQPPTIGISSGDGDNYNLSVFDQATNRNNVASILWTPEWYVPPEEGELAPAIDREPDGTSEADDSATVEAPAVSDNESAVEQVLLTPAESGVDDLGVVEPTWPDDDERGVSESVLVRTVPVAADALEADVTVSTDGVVDNRDNTQAKMFRVISGDWRVSCLVEGFYGRDYQYVRAREDGETARAQFVCRSLPTGTYDVYAWWSSRKDRGTSVAYEIHHADGVAEVRVDQTSRGGAWNKLGTYRFAAGAHLVEVHNGASGENGFVCADAVNFVPRQIETTSNSAPTVGVLKSISVTQTASSSSNTIIPGASSSLTLTTLNEPGLLVTPGSRLPVAWASVNLARYTPVSVCLYRGGEKVETLMAATPNDGEFVWAVNPDLRGDGYTLRIGVVGAENTLFGETEPFVVGLACEW